MKRLFTLLILLELALGIEARPVGVEKARKVGIDFLKANTSMQVSKDVELAYAYLTDSGTPCIYVFNVVDGFVVVSADDHAYPILGYSDQGKFDVELIPVALHEHLRGFVEQIEWAVKEDHVSSDVIDQWRQVELDGTLLAQKNINVVEPLLSDTWNQDCYYNDLCPVDYAGPCGHVYVGCTSLAIGQIMHFWQYPEHGQGSATYTPSGYPQQSVNFAEATYDYDNMPNSLNGGSPQIQRTAIATMLWHIGVAMHANYGPNGTGAAPENVPNVMRTYFRFANNLQGKWKNDNASWIVDCKASLDLGRPIHYSGWTDQNEGHSFVCDGYNANDQFYFNWGWSGYGNGYFAIGALNAPGYQFNNGNYAVFNIHPIGDVQYNVTTTSNPSNGGTTSGGGSFDEGQSCTVHATAAQGFNFVNWTENGTQVSTNANYTFVVNNNRNLVAHFAQIPTYTVTTTSNPSNGGSTSGGGFFTQGQSCTVHATAANGYDFVNWTENGTQVSTDASYTFIVNNSRNLTANFSIQTFSVIVDVDSEMGVVAGAGVYDYGDVCTVTATANEHFEFLCWLEENDTVSFDAEYSFEVLRDFHLIACFAPIKYEINVLVNPLEGGIASGVGKYTFGENVTLSVDLNEHYFFENWTENGEIVSTDSEYTFEIESDRNLVANLYYFDGIAETVSENVTVYPNPVKDGLVLRFSENVGSALVNVVNVKGQILYAEKCNDGHGAVIDMQDFASGVYFIRIVCASGEVVTRKIVK